VPRVGHGMRVLQQSGSAQLTRFFGSKSLSQRIILHYVTASVLQNAMDSSCVLLPIGWANNAGLHHSSKASSGELMGTGKLY
jgi:hypothetical protein